MGQKIIKKVIKHFRKKKATSKAVPTADKTKSPKQSK